VAASTLLRTARRRADLTQAQLAERAGLSQAEVARLERAGSNPTAATLERLLRATGHRLELRRLDAVDETQLRERLGLTPAERLAAFEASQGNLTRLARGARRVSSPAR
jgi:DNA-binding XRE family transcriptional regulator